ncbi:hypothetical protein FB451DRAFT_1492996 [Mycena latifolia]|nr:hypothetical protein FB451DRAFT_1492996 [Mycena latifolia]
MRILDISQKLEFGSYRDVSICMLPAVNKEHVKLNQDDAAYRKLNADWVEAVGEVQRKPGFQGFLRPKLMNELRTAAIHGPIIILNASSSKFTALIVTLSEDVQSINLEMTWQRAQLLVKLLHTLISGSSVEMSQILTKIQPRDTATEPETSQDRLLGTLENSEGNSPDKVFGWLLAELWILIVEPVFRALELKKTNQLPNCRLWWCPTGPLTFLPIHAAGLYGDNGRDCVSDYVVSSYTPGLASLLDRPLQTGTVQDDPGDTTSDMKSLTLASHQKRTEKN